MLPREHYVKQPFYGLNELIDAAELTSAQQRLIKKHGTLITALLKDEVLNPNLADMRLVKVITQKSAPTTPVEQAWLKFESLREQTAKPRKKLKKTA